MSSSENAGLRPGGAGAAAPAYAAQFRDLVDALQLQGTQRGGGLFAYRATYPRALQRSLGLIERLLAGLNFCHQLCGAYPDRAAAWQAHILEAGRVALNGLRGKAVDLEALVAQAEAILSPIGQVAKEYTLLCVSHAHIDMNWMWSWPETVAVTHDTFQTMLTLMDEFPAFIYSQSQASTYALIERYDPAMFQAIRQRVGEGRWEVTASQWVEGDKNMSSGESISRHLLYTREYFQDRFGLAPEDVRVDFEPDTFGHPATLPTILARGGVRYYYHCRGSRGPHLYWWEGPDGSRILAFNDVTWYMCTIDPPIADPLVEFSLATGLKQMPVLYGVGDHGGGPTQRDLNRLIEMNAWPIYPNVECSSLHRFFRAAEASARPDLPVVTGERNFVFPGCYTSQARQKWANRHGENLLYAAESAAVVGHYAAEVPYPRENLDEAWKHLLFDQFHDILPGSGMRETRHYALGKAQDSQAAASMARSSALHALGERIDTASLRRAFPAGLDETRAYKDDVEAARAFGAGVGHATATGGESAFSVTQSSDRAFLVFNPLPYPRTEVVEAKLWDVSLDPSRLVVTAEGMPPQPVQVLDKGDYWGHTYTTVAFPVEVPALGYRVVCVSDRMAELGLLDDGIRDPWAGSGGSARTVLPPDYALENEFLRVCLDPASGAIASLLDRRTGREWVPAGGLTGILQHCLESNEGMSAWVIGQYLERTDLRSGGTLQEVHCGPYVQMLRWTYPRKQVGAYDTRITLDVAVRKGMPQVAFTLRVDWREIGHPEGGIPHLKVRFPVAIQSPQPRYEVPFGAVRRDLFDGQEVPALRWVDLSEADGAGVTLVNNSKYGFSLEREPGGAYSLNMTLLRASVEPDPLPDLGEHVIEYALVPHGSGWTVGDCVQAGEAMNVPLTVASCGLHPGALPTSGSFLEVASKGVRLASLKQAQDGRGVIVRLVEVEGIEARAELTLAPELSPTGASAIEVDTLERPLASNSARLAGGVLSVNLGAFGVTSVRVDHPPASS
jgi:alpha-mannosidase